jgi:hypothetical protein
LRKNLSTRCGDQPRKIHITATMMKKPSAAPMMGESTMKMTVFVHPEGRMTPKPEAATAAPA